VAREVFKELALSFGVLPLPLFELVMVATRLGSQPHLMQGLLQIHNDLAAVTEREGDHAAHPLVVDVGIGLVIDAIATALNA
jgi:hypothetical protein